MILGVIPARFASTRFPGKPLVSIAGKSMIQRVYEQASLAKRIQEVVVATDDSRIYEHVRSFSGNVVMTNPKHPSGTDRCAEVALQFPEASIILNIQGDEPFIQPEQIDVLVETLLQSDHFEVATLAKHITKEEELHNPNVVKVVFSQKHAALYFSRHAIPYVRAQAPEKWLEHYRYYKHIGLYAFRRDALQRIAALPPSSLEQAESLEQLRWLDNGLQIAVGITNLETTGIDTPEDLERLLR
jgi:3-deoxy-manno-octulosonate cytidylyltransferase (CMP-KDO synthetase)